MHVRWPRGTPSSHEEGWGRRAYQDTASMSMCLVSILSEGVAGWEARRSLWMTPPESEFRLTVLFIAYMNVVTTCRTPSYRTAFSAHAKINEESSGMTEFKT